MKGWAYNHRSKDLLDKFTLVVDERNEKRVEAGISNAWSVLFAKNTLNTKSALSQKSVQSISSENTQDDMVTWVPGTINTKVSNIDDLMDIADAKSQNSSNSCTFIDGVDISVIIEQMKIEFKSVKDSNVSYLEKLLEHSNFEKIISRLQKNSCKQLLSNVSIAFLIPSENNKLNQNELFYTHILLPILKNDEVNRNLEQAILERVEKYDADIFKYIFVPLMLTDEQSCIITVAALSKINTKSKENLLREYLRHGSYCCKEVVLPVILMLYKSVSQHRTDEDVTDEMITFLLSGNERFSKNINFGKILHAVSQNLKEKFLNIPQDSDARKNMVKIINDNETPFKNSCKALLGLK